MTNGTRRQHKRFGMEMPVVLIATAYGTTTISSGRTSDMSEGGMAVVTAATFQENQDISIEFKPPLESLLIKMRATVRHQAHNLYGLQFQSASEQQLAQLRRLMMN